MPRLSVNSINRTTHKTTHTPSHTIARPHLTPQYTASKYYSTTTTRCGTYITGPGGIHPVRIG